ncbi:uncharacterized protein LOC142352803 [Convolutriloba macropyga]|uniref:uncharacterized protein LOC142352803 n=1 Tax=Convolutriloba macropyga TaxID=536237 RepID=UPI003F527C5D
MKMDGQLEVDCLNGQSETSSRKRRLPEQYPAFAAILSFLTNYSLLLGCVGEINFTRLSEWFQSDSPIGDDFIDFCVNLLKRLNRRANKDNWQEQLSVIFSRHSEVDSWILRCSGFRKLNLQSRLNVFKYVLEKQFDSNEKFRQLVETLPCEDMRVLPVGSDERGHIYWYFQDSKLNLLLYREEQEDEGETSFTLLARSIEQFACILAKLDMQDFTVLDIKELKQTPDTPEISFMSASANIGNSNCASVPELSQIKSEDNNKIEDKEMVKDEPNDDHLTPEDSENNSSNVQVDKNSAIATANISNIKTEPQNIENASQAVKCEREVTKVEKTEVVESNDRPATPVQKDSNSANVSSNDVQEPAIANTNHLTPKKKLLQKFSNESDDLSSTDDGEKRRSSRIKRAPKNCYSIDETFKMIYSQTQVTPPTKKLKLSSKHDVDAKDTSKSATELSELPSEDIPLAMIASGEKKSSKKKGKKGKSKSKKKKRKHDSESEENDSDNEPLVAVQDEDEDEEEIYPGEEDYQGCAVCLKKSRPDTILLCDECDSSFHMACLRPPLFIVPDQEWFCPACCHKKLILALRGLLDTVQQQAIAHSRKRRYVSAEVPLGFPSYVNSLLPPEPPKQDFSHLFGELPLQGRSLREKKRVNYGYDSYDQEIKAAIKAHNSPLKPEQVNGGGYSSDNSSSNRLEGSPSKYGIRSSRRLNFLEPSADVAKLETCDLNSNSNINSDFEVERLTANDHGRDLLSDDDCNEAPSVGSNERSGSDSNQDAELEREAQYTFDDNPAMFSSLIAETSEAAVDNEENIKTPVHKMDLIEPQADNINLTQRHDETISNQTANDVHLSKDDIKIQNGRRSPVKVGKVAKIEKLRQLHSNPSAFSRVVEPENAINSNKIYTPGNDEPIKPEAETTNGEVYEQKTRITAAKQSDFVYFDDDAYSDAEPDDDYDDNDDGSDYDVTKDVKEGGVKVNNRVQHNRSISSGRSERARGGRYMVDEDFCADELSDSRLRLVNR